MPSRVYPSIPNMNYIRMISSEELLDAIRCTTNLLIIDCRVQTDYQEFHIRDAINVTLPSSMLMLRRLANGRLCLPDIIKDNKTREKFTKLWKNSLIVVYDEEGHNDFNKSSIMFTICGRLAKDGCHAICLQGGFNTFKKKYPEWCERENAVEPSLLGLENLCITSINDSDRTIKGTSINDSPFPTEIIPWLFLGNAENSCDLDSLRRHKICYILNVTPNLPNAFQQDDMGIKYMQLPIQDDWSQKILPFFTEAINFIDEARENSQGVLVHCLAGISRSVTITLAYLMHTLSISLNDAYDLVKKRKSNISPNFNFMEQLVDYERQLNLTSCQDEDYKCPALYSSPTSTGTTPDSGIVLDRWD